MTMIMSKEAREQEMNALGEQLEMVIAYMDEVTLRDDPLTPKEEKELVELREWMKTFE